MQECGQIAIGFLVYQSLMLLVGALFTIISCHQIYSDIQRTRKKTAMDPIKRLFHRGAFLVGMLYVVLGIDPSGVHNIYPIGVRFTVKQLIQLVVLTCGVTLGYHAFKVRFELRNSVKEPFYLTIYCNVIRGLTWIFGIGTLILRAIYLEHAAVYQAVWLGYVFVWWFAVMIPVVYSFHKIANILEIPAGSRKSQPEDNVQRQNEQAKEIMRIRNYLLGVSLVIQSLVLAVIILISSGLYEGDDRQTNPCRFTLWDPTFGLFWLLPTTYMTWQAWEPCKCISKNLQGYSDSTGTNFIQSVFASGHPGAMRKQLGPDFRANGARSIGITVTHSRGMTLTVSHHHKSSLGNLSPFMDDVTEGTESRVSDRITRTASRQSQHGGSDTAAIPETGQQIGGVCELEPCAGTVPPRRRTESLEVIHHSGGKPTQILSKNSKGIGDATRVMSMATSSKRGSKEAESPVSSNESPEESASEA